MPKTGAGRAVPQHFSPFAQPKADTCAVMKGQRYESKTAHQPVVDVSNGMLLDGCSQVIQASCDVGVQLA